MKQAQAQHHWFLYPFFHKYASYIINKHFYDIKIITTLKIEDKPLLLIANHSTWWDGFFASHINTTILKRRFHIMVQSETLHKFPFFIKTGAYPIHKNTKSIIQTLHYTCNLLSNASNVVVMFPQGKIQSVFEQEIKFERGIEYIFKHTSNTIQLLFMTTLTEYFSQKKPTLYIYLTNANINSTHLYDIEHAYNQFFTTCKQHNCTL